jgi:hypothetical protein
MQSRDFLEGSFEFQTEITRDGDDYIASAQGYSAKHRSQDQAINDLNRKLSDAMESGRLQPGMGN